MQGMQIRIVLIFIMTLSLVSYAHTCVSAQESGANNLTEIEALLDLLEAKGVVDEKEVEAVKMKSVDGRSPSGALIQLLKQKGIISETEALGFEQQYGKAEEKAPVQPNQDQVSPDDLNKVEESLQKEIDHANTDSRLNRRKIEQLEEQRVDPLADDMRKTSWAKRLALSGDLRLRYQQDLFDSENAILAKPTDPTETMNTREDRIRFRGRARLGLKATLLDPREVNVGKVTAALRLTSGNDDDPVSTNETLGDYNNKDSFLLDRYYLQWKYKPQLPIWGRIPQFTLTGGRMPNPWFSSDLIWDDDLNFEGVALNLKTDTLQENGWHIFLTAGAFPLQEEELSDRDKWLYAGQIGFEAQPSSRIRTKLALAYYHYENIDGVVNDPSQPGLTDFTAPQFLQKGNTYIDIDPSSAELAALAADYEIVDVTGMLDLMYFFPVHVIFEGTYAVNIGFDKNEVARKTGNPDIKEDNQAYRFGFKVGYPKISQSGEWNFFYYYKYLEADAVLDAFTDSDFHLGGTNTEGWLAGFEYGLYKNVWFKFRWLTANEISGPPLSIDVMQVDLNARF